MKTNLFIGLCIAILLLAAPAMATLSRNYETTAVARIVGDSATDMEQQLKKGDIELEHLTIFQNQHLSTITIAHELFEQDDDNINDMYLDSVLQDKNLNQEDFDQFETNELLYIDKGLKKIDETGLKAAFSGKNPFFIYNYDYAGITAPIWTSLTRSVAKDAIVIAPTFYSSAEFAKALLCNLQSKGVEAGEIFMQARNNYYWHANINKEPIGLMLLSYMLYGLPTRKISTPDDAPSSFCEKYQEDFTISSNNNFNILSTSTNTNTYKKSFEFKITEHEIATEGDYSLIETDKTVQSMTPYELVLPKRTLMEEFPPNTVITNYSVTKMADAVSITANIPTLNETGMMQRVCYEKERNATVEFSQSYTEDSRVVLTNIYPVEIVDCDKGKFKLYKTIKYEIEYIPFSPVLIKEIAGPSEMLPGQKSNITIEIENTQSGPVNGTIVMTDETGSITIAKPIKTTRDKYKIELTAPEQEGIYTYRADFYYPNESVTYKEFDFEVKTIDLELIIPETATTEAEIELVVKSGLASSFSTNIEFYLLHSGKKIDSATKSTTIEPGENTITHTFDNLDRSKIVYEVIAGVPYQNSYKAASGTIITEHVPVVVQSDIAIKENETFTLNPQIYDIDGDDVTSRIKYPFSYNENWIASFEQSGEYEIKITADDGIKEITRVIQLLIENVNRPPKIHAIDQITIKENETYILSADSTDPDNENSVDNDDNTITYAYNTLFDENGTWMPSFEESGKYTVNVTVSDGEYEDMTTAQITVLNTNRPPVITAEDEITVNEGDLITIDTLAYDPDNQNIVENDDNVLTTQVTAPLDENATWQTTDEDSGEYDVTITVSDGEYETTKDITIKVQDVNRAPEISNLENITVKEGELITLAPIITDLDNLNNVTNDDNEISIIYTEPFSSNGTWQTDYEDSGEYTITVKARDGIVETTQDILVVVENINRAPTIAQIQDVQVKEGETITITPVIADPDNDNSVDTDDNELTVTYSELIPSEGTLATNYESSGEHTITVTVSDGELTAETTFKLTIDNVNRAPEITVEDVHIKEGAIINMNDIVIDPDNENSVDNDDNNLIITYPSQFVDGIWETDDEDSGSYDFTISAYDGEFNTTEEVTIIIDNVNRAPVIETINDITAYEGELVEAAADYYDPDNENGVTNDDNHLTVQFDLPLNNEGKWQTGFFDAGTHEIKFQVTDGSLKTIQTFTVTVLNTNRLPSIKSYEPATTITINEGETQKFKVNAKDPDQETLNLEWYFDGESIGTKEDHTYTPSYTDSGTHEIKVLVTDSQQESVDHIWTIHVENKNRLPEVQEIKELRVAEGDPAIITVEAADPDGQELTYSLDDSRFEQDNNVFTWQTTFADSGVYDLELTVSDGEDEITQTIKLVIANFNHIPQINDYYPKHTKYISENEDITLSITPFDSDNEPLTTTWYVDAEEKGTGETFLFNPAGELKTFHIKAEVTDGNATAEQEFTIESVDRPKLDEYDEESTDISEYTEEELSSIAGFTLKKGKAEIKFIEPVDLSTTLDIENNAKLNNDMIALNTQEIPALNKQARLTFYDVHFTQNPIIYYTSKFVSDSNDAEDICPPELCYDITYENNILSFTVAHFTTYIIRETPFKQYHLQTPAKIVLDTGEDETEFTIRNSGLLDIKNLEITSMFNKGSFVITPTKLDIEKGDTETIKIEGTVQRPSKAGRTKIGSITLQNKDISKEIPVYLELEEKLNIGRLEISVGDKTYSSVEDKDRIKAKPGSHIELEFMIENNLDELTIEDIIITAETEDDYDESDYFDITSSNYKTKILELDLPKMLDENKYDLVITAEGEDEKRTEYETKWTINLRVDREKHDTKIENPEISPVELKCDKETRITFDLSNYGTANEENLKIDIQNKELDIDIQDYVNIQEASETEFRYKIIFDDYQKAKQYNIPVNIYYDDEQLADSKEIKLNVLSCGTAAATNTPKTTIKAQATIKLDNSKPVLKKTGDDTFTLTAMLLILLALLLLLAGLLFLKAVY